MQDFAFHSPAAQPGRYFEGGGKRVLHTVCQDDGRAGKSLEMLDNQPFHSAGGDEQDAEIIGRQLVDILVIYEIDGEIFSSSFRIISWELRTDACLCSSEAKVIRLMTIALLTILKLV